MTKGKLYEKLHPYYTGYDASKLLDEAKKEYSEAVEAAPYDYIMVDSWFEKWFGDE